MKQVTTLTFAFHLHYKNKLIGCAIRYHVVKESTSRIIMRDLSTEPTVASASGRPYREGIRRKRPYRPALADGA
jgi:hypothetical protein